MGRRIRFVPDRSLVEITCRTIQGRFLLKPFMGWREIFVGALARAQMLYPIEIHAFVCLSNHFHLLVSPQDARELAAFMRHLLSKLSIEAGRQHGWRGPLFQRRYQAILISGETRAQVQRLRYLLSHGVKENLVARVADWPGPHCFSSLASGIEATGVWHDRTAEWRARRRGQQPKRNELNKSLTLALAPLPCWAGLAPEAHQRAICELVEEAEDEATRQRRSQAVTYLGARAILDQHPHQSPVSSKRSPAPFCHAFTKRMRRDLRKAYGIFLGAFREAARRLNEGDRDACFPAGSFPPAIPFRWAVVHPRAAPPDRAIRSSHRSHAAEP